MKTNAIPFLLMMLVVGVSLADGQPLGEVSGSAQTTGAGPTNSSNAAISGVPAPSLGAVAESGTVARAGDGQKGSDGLRLNFRGAPLETVLDYLSEAAGFIIVLEAQPKGTVDVWSEQTLTREEACNVLNSALMKNGYAAVRKGRTLTIMNRDEARTHALPVKLSSDPGTIPETDELVTQIIPVRFIEVAQLIKDLQPLVSTRAIMTANESANTIVITETQAGIHRVAEIIKAIDCGAEDFTAVRVFSMKNADPVEMTDLLTQLFPDESRNQDSQAPIQFGGPGGLPGPGGFGGPPGFGGLPGAPPGGAGSGGGVTANSSSQKLRTKKRASVVAVADPRTAALVVSAPKDLMRQIELIVADLDSNPARKQSVAVYQLKNARAQEVMNVLQNLFQKNTTSTARNTTSQTDALETRSAQQQQQGQLSGAGARTGFGGNGGGGAAAGGFGGGVGQ